MAKRKKQESSSVSELLLFTFWSISLCSVFRHNFESENRSRREIWEEGKSRSTHVRIAVGERSQLSLPRLRHRFRRSMLGASGVRSTPPPPPPPPPDKLQPSPLPVGSNIAPPQQARHRDRDPVCSVLGARRSLQRRRRHLLPRRLPFPSPAAFTAGSQRAAAGQRIPLIYSKEHDHSPASAIGYRTKQEQLQQSQSAKQLPWGYNLQFNLLI